MEVTRRSMRARFVALLSFEKVSSEKRNSNAFWGRVMSLPLLVLSDSEVVDSCLPSPPEGSAIADGGADIQTVPKPIKTMIARVKAYFTKPDILAFPIAPALMGEGLHGVFRSTSADLSGRAPVTLDGCSVYEYPGKMAMLSTVRK